jgi:hypothetical protein
LPTGAAIVSAFGVAIALVALARGWRRVRWVPTLGVMVAVAGLLLALFPRLDHWWLDAVERFVPAVQTVFLTDAEREAHQDATESIARGEAELARIRVMQEEVRWGTREMSEEKQERMRQYIAGRSEIVAGDQLTLRELKTSARERQRWALGLPLLAAGIAVLWFAAKGRRPTSG